MSPLFWSGGPRSLGILVPPDQHPQESALVTMVRVGDCGPAGYNGPGWGLWSGWL